MTTLRQFPLEGTAGTAVTAANSGFDLVSAGGSAADTYSTSATFQGSTGATFTSTTADAAFAEANFASACSTAAVDLAFTVPSSTPSSDVAIGQLYDVNSARVLAVAYRANGDVITNDKGNTYRTIVPAAQAPSGTKLRIEIVVSVISATGGTFTARAYDTSAAQVGSTVSASTANLGSAQMAKFRVGCLTAAGYTVPIDAVQIADSRTTEIGPITAANNPPYANAGTDQSGNLGSTFTLGNGTAAASDSDGTVAGTAWTCTAYPSAGNPTISSPTSLNGATVTPTVVGTYTFTLTVTDNSGAKSTSTSNITVLAVPTSGGGYGGSPITLDVLTPGDPALVDNWGPRNTKNFQVAFDALNALINYQNTPR